LCGNATGAQAFQQVFFAKQRLPVRQRMLNSGEIPMSLRNAAILLPMVLTILNSAKANPYDNCMLDHAQSIKSVSADGIDVIAEACIKSTEEPLDAAEAAKAQMKFFYGEMVRGTGELGLILQIYNGSPYDITSITVSLTDKKKKTQRLYRRELWFLYNRGPGFITSYGPRYKNRFIKSLTSGEYLFPLEALNVPQANFFNLYDVTAVSALGVR
jgi:hypothetical protein